MATPPRTKIAATPPAGAAIVLASQVQEQVRARAYQLYEQRGKIEGHDLEDWLQAEAELLPSSKTAQS